MAPPDVAMCDWAPLRVFQLIPMGSRSLAGKVDLHPQAKQVDVWWPERKVTIMAMLAKLIAS
ncbi:hypothetical protein NC651_012380 [Populus alba x Populus x berolinensis]|nr:hypothetical protein NC651_012380 [Populus alba x Populus x berolinensis]